MQKKLIKSEYGLPEDKFIYACFNQIYKITPDIFSIWMRILKRVPDSILWFIRLGSEYTEENLKLEASKAGIDSNRIIFSDPFPADQHILIKSMAHLFLDTLNFGGHSSVADILWAGVPIITYPDRKFSSRVGASLVTALGCPEMIVTSLTDYEDKAVTLATNKAAYTSLRSKLWRNRLTEPLFNTRLWVTNLEKALERVHLVSILNREPSNINTKHIWVEEPGERVEEIAYTN